MLPRVDNQTSSNLSPATIDVLQGMFISYTRLVVKHDFSEFGYSGSWVYLIHPFKERGGHQLPVVVKIASISLIEKEWQAYKDHIRHYWLAIADLRNEPVFLENEQLAGLCYQFIGGNVFKPKSLREYCLDTQTSADDIHFILSKRLLHIIKKRVIHPSKTRFDYSLQAIYDMVLPVNLLLVPEAIPPNEAYTLITPDQLPHTDFADRGTSLEEGSCVRLEGFIVTKVDLRDKSVTLNLPSDRVLRSYRVRIQSIKGLEGLRFKQVLPPFEGVVIETSASRFAAEVANIGINDPTSPTIRLSNGSQEENPLLMIPKILAKTRHLKFNAIHGDLNLENVLVDPVVRDISVIDFSEARDGYVLHDLLHLEMEVITKLLPDAFSKAYLPPEYLFEFYQALHHVTLNLSNQPATESFALPLQKPFMMLKEIRQVAREGLYDREDISEYYDGLFLYLLGAVRFGNLDEEKKEANELNRKEFVFYAAIAIHKLITTPPQPSTQSVKEVIQPYFLLLNPLFAGRGVYFSFFELNLKGQLKQTSWLIYLITFIFAFILVISLFYSPIPAQCEPQTLTNWISCLYK